MAKAKITREVWRAIPGYPGYKVSNRGRVKSPRKMLKPITTANPYPMVALKNQIKVYVHAVVLLAFVGPPPKRKICRHLDDRPTNNKLSNLCYGTRKQNWEDSVKHGTARRGEKNHNSLLTEKSVKEIRLSNETYDVLAKKYKVKKSTILNVRCGRSWAWLK